MKKRKLLLLVILFNILVIASLLSLYSVGHLKIISNYPVTAWLEDHQADCGVVLTGGPNRIGEAFELLYLKKVKKVIISGVHPSTELRDLFPQKPYYGDIDSDDIILEKRSLTTYGNAQQTLPLVEALNCKDVVLITSRIHMHRAFQTFRSHFPKEIPIYRRSTVGRRLKIHWTRLAIETLKTVFYDFWFF